MTGEAVGAASSPPQEIGTTIAALRQALANQPACSDTRQRLAGALLAAGNACMPDQPEAAERAYRDAIYVQPGYVDAMSNLGEALVAQHRLTDALALFRAALTLRPSDARTGFSYAFTLLLNFDLSEGWRQFEARRSMAAWHYDRRRDLPHWQQGIDPRGRYMLVMAEQGIGDVVQFARYLPALRQRAARVTLEVPTALLSLLRNRTDGIAVVTPNDPVPGCDLACPMMSLPLLLDADTLPGCVPYPRAPADRVARWCDYLAPFPGLRIGLVCSGDPRHSRDAIRSVPFTTLAPLLAVPDTRFVLLQTEARDADRAAIQATPDILVPDRLLTDYADTAALIAGLDLVIAADTGVAHLAAALGRPVWLMLPFNPDWRWCLHRRDTAWYPTMTLYRQRRRGAWDEVVAALRADLLIQRRV